MRKILASFLQALIGSIKKVKPFVTHLQKYLLTFNNVIHSFYYMNIKFILFSFLVVSRRRPRINVSKYLPLPTYLAIQFNLFLYFSEQTHCKHIYWLFRHFFTPSSFVHISELSVFPRHTRSPILHCPVTEKLSEIAQAAGHNT